MLIQRFDSSEKSWVTIHEVELLRGDCMATVNIPPKAQQPMDRVRLFFKDGWGGSGYWLSVAAVSFKASSTSTSTSTTTQAATTASGPGASRLTDGLLDDGVQSRAWVTRRCST
eukprot:3267207-Prymnesium_polylepis.1